MRIGIVGHEASKFTASGQEEARQIIRALLTQQHELPNTLVSGGCHLGGVDIWAEEEADKLGLNKIICLPHTRQWEPNGYKQRNLEIVERADIIHCLAVVRLAPSYRGMRFDYCYHCGTDDHIKGGGCWTMKQAANLGMPTQLHLIQNVP